MAYHVTDSPSDLHSVLMAVPKSLLRNGQFVDVDAFDDETLEVITVVTHGKPSLEDVFDILEGALGPVTAGSDRTIMSEDGEVWSWMVVQPHIASQFVHKSNT